MCAGATCIAQKEDFIVILRTCIHEFTMKDNGDLSKVSKLIDFVVIAIETPKEREKD